MVLHPPSQSDKYYFEQIGKALDIYNKNYTKMLLAGHFNAEESKGGRKCIKHFIKHHQTPMFDEMLDAFEMNHNLEKFRKEEKNRV